MNTVSPFHIPDSEANVRATSHELIRGIEEGYKTRIQEALARVDAQTGFQVQCVVLSRDLYLKQLEVWQNIAPEGASLEQVLGGTITHHIDTMAHYLPHHINRTEPIFDSLEDIAKVPSVQLGWYEFDLNTAQEKLIEEFHGRLEVGKKFSWKDIFSLGSSDFRVNKEKKIQITKHGLTEEGRRVLEAYNDIKRTYGQQNSITLASPEIQV